MAEGIRVEGLSLLIRNLRKVNSDYPKEAKAIHLKVAEPVASVARRRVPRRSSRLAGTIRAQSTQRVARVAAGARLKYAGVIHYGWPGHNITAQPFLADALRESQHEVLRVYEVEMDRFIDRAWQDNF
jgi:hypothetical protein